MTEWATTVSAPGRPRPVTPVGLVEQHLADVLALLRADGSAGGLDPRIRDGVALAHALVAGLDPYLEANAGTESLALRTLAEQTASHAWAPPLEQEMLSGRVEGQFLRILARAVRARRVLEIGMFTGYATLALAEALPDDGRVVACEIDADAAAMAQRGFAGSLAGERIDVRLGPALATLDRLAEEKQSFDLVFVDADKAGYTGYVERLLHDGLLAQGGLICVDNTLMQGQPWLGDQRTANGEAVAAFNQAIAGDARLEQVIVPLRDGLTLIRRIAD